MRMIAGLCIVLSMCAVISIGDKNGASNMPGRYVTAYIDEDFSGDYYVVPITALRVSAPLPGATACDASMRDGTDDYVYVACNAYVRMGGHYVGQ